MLRLYHEVFLYFETAIYRRFDLPVRRFLLELAPSLMQGMSMLCALVMDYEGSECWYGELQKFVEHCGRQDAAGKQARGARSWYSVSALPSAV